MVVQKKPMNKEGMLPEVMEVTGPNGSKWVLDGSLREKAKVLVEKFSGDLGHIQLERVVLVRAVGVNSTTWFGKCKYIGELPNSIIPRHLINTLMSYGMLDSSQLKGLESELLDIRYIITLNDTALVIRAGTEPGFEELKETLEVITLYHELMHIPSDMIKCRQHDVQDFAKVLDRFGVYWSDGIVEISTKRLGLSMTDAQAYLEELNKLNIKPALLEDFEDDGRLVPRPKV